MPSSVDQSSSGRQSLGSSTQSASRPSGVGQSSSERQSLGSSTQSASRPSGVGQSSSERQCPTHPSLRANRPFEVDQPLACAVVGAATELSDGVQPGMCPPFPDEDAFQSGYSIPVYNTFNPLSSVHSNDRFFGDGDTHPHTNNDIKDSSKHHHRIHPNRSPLNILTDVALDKRANALLIGDSVLNHVDPRRMALRSYMLQKINVPGISTIDLKEWLANTPPQEQIKAVVIHIGINDCPAGPVSVQQWTDIIQLCHSSFPQAKIAFSSIIPAKGRHNLNNAVVPSNRNLRHACTESFQTCIDNTESFVAPSGAPKLNMYWDVTHPSFKGTARLAYNIKNAFLSWLRDSPRRYNHNPSTPDFARSQQRNHTSEQHDLTEDQRLHSDLPVSSRDSPRDDGIHSYDANHAAYYRPHGHNLYVDNSTRWHSASHASPNYVREHRRKQFPNSGPGDGKYSHIHNDYGTRHVSDEGPPPLYSTYHYPSLNRTEYNRDSLYEPVHLPPPSPHENRDPTPQSSMRFQCDSQNTVSIPRVHNFPPNSQGNVMHYLYLLNMMTSQMLNAQPQHTMSFA